MPWKIFFSITISGKNETGAKQNKTTKKQTNKETKQHNTKEKQTIKKTYETGENKELFDLAKK